MSWLRSSVMSVSVFGLLIGSAIPASAQQSGLVDDEPDAITGDLGLSNGTVQFCVDEGMSLEEIEADSGECLTRFWTAERVAEAAENAEHQDEVLSEADLSGGSAQHRDGLFSEGDELPDLTDEQLGDLCTPASDDDPAEEFGDWADEVDSDGIWPPGVTESYSSIQTGQLLSTRPSVEALCGRDADDPVERQTYACSAAAVVTDAGDSIVITAGHCLHEGGANGGTFHQDVMFYPGWNAVDYFRPAMGGMYAGEVASVMPEYVEYATLGDTSIGSGNDDISGVANFRDVGFLVVGNDNSSIRQQSLRDRIGGYGISFEGNGVVGSNIAALGYPRYVECSEQESPQTHACVDMDISERENVDINIDASYTRGGLMVGCEERVEEGPEPISRVNISIDSSAAIRDCGFRPGVSGGPWLSGYDIETDTGVVVGVNSGLPYGTPSGVVMSPIFDHSEDGSVEDLYLCTSRVVDNRDVECAGDWRAWG